MASMDAQAIYDNFHTHAQGTPGLAGAQQTAEELAITYQDRAVSTQQLIDGVQTGWKGTASEAAAQGLTPLAVSSLDTGSQLTTGHGIVGQQVDSFHTAVSEVQPVPPAPQMSNVIAAAATGQDTTPMIDQISHSYTVQASNIVAYSKYVSASQSNTSSLPPITPVDSPTAPVSVTTPPPPAASASTGSTHAPAVSGGSDGKANAARATGTGAAGSGSGSSRPPAGGSSPTPPPGPSSSGSTTTSGATSPVTSPPQSSSTGPAGGFGPGPNPPLGPGGGMPGGNGPWPGGGPTSGLPGDGENVGTGPGGRSGLGAVADDVDGLGGIRPGAGSSGGRMAFGPNSGAGSASGAGGEQGPSSRSGAGAGLAGTAEEEALAAERSGAGPGGMSSAGAMGAGRGRGGEDSEHHRKIGVEEDGEELFGLTDAVMPPVVGENRAEREQRYAEEESRHGEL